jgi:hypothetical protein
VTWSCGPLDLDDARTSPIGALPPPVVIALVRAAAASAAYDGPPPPAGAATVVPGRRTVIKVQHRRHETLSVLTALERIRVRSGLPAPALLACGELDLDGGPYWWTVLARATGVHGGPGDRLAERQRRVGALLRRWHDTVPATGYRLDDPGAAALFFGEIRMRDRPAALRLVAALDRACRGAPMSAIHGDLAVGHNVLFCGGRPSAVLDPGAVQVGPPMVDLAWSVAVDLGLGGTIHDAVDGYGCGRVDTGLLHRLLPLMAQRRYVDVVAQRCADEAARLAAWLVAHDVEPPSCARPD